MNVLFGFIGVIWLLLIVELFCVLVVMLIVYLLCDCLIVDIFELIEG